MTITCFKSRHFSTFPVFFKESRRTVKSISFFHIPLPRITLFLLTLQARKQAAKRLLYCNFVVHGFVHPLQSRHCLRSTCSSMDRMEDSGSSDYGSIPYRCTLKAKTFLYSLYVIRHSSIHLKHRNGICRMGKAVSAWLCSKGVCYSAPPI